MIVACLVVVVAFVLVFVFVRATGFYMSSK